MQVEALESMAVSWLRHVKGCLLAQSNWKRSPLWNIEHLDQITPYYNHFVDEVFGKQTLQQVFNQTEVDAVGISSDRIYMVECANHENGCDIPAVERFARKLLKDTLLASSFPDAFWSNRKLVLVYMATWVQNGARAQLTAQLTELAERLRFAPPTLFGDPAGAIVFGEGAQPFAHYTAGGARPFEIQILEGPSLANEVLGPLLDNLDAIKDTSELFIRSMKLYKILEENRTPAGATNAPRVHNPQGGAVPAHSPNPQADANQRRIFDNDTLAAIAGHLAQHWPEFFQDRVDMPGFWGRNAQYPLIATQDFINTIPNGNTRYRTAQHGRNFRVCSQLYPYHQKGCWQDVVRYETFRGQQAKPPPPIPADILTNDMRRDAEIEWGLPG